MSINEFAIHSDQLWLLIAIIACLIVISGFMSFSESAFSAMSRARMSFIEKNEPKKSKQASWILSMHEKIDQHVASILIGNNLVNILASSLATALAISIFGEAGVIYATLILTLLIVLFAEILPKTLALRRPEAGAFVASYVMRYLLAGLRPLTLVITWPLHKILGRVSLQIDSNELENELRGAISIYAKSEEEALAQSENPTHNKQDMLRSILDLSEISVAEVMTHRREVSMINLDLGNEALIDTILQSPYTRLPVYKEHPDNIVGIVHAKNVIQTYRRFHGKTPVIKELLTVPWFVVESTTLFDQLVSFQKRRAHMACIVDEYGAFLGVVTLEDVLEQIVGNIEDEYDLTVSGITQDVHFPGAVVVSGDLPVRVLNREMRWQLPEDVAVTTAGLVMKTAKLIPKLGQSFRFFGFRFDVVSLSGNRITKIRVTAPSGPETH